MMDARPFQQPVLRVTGCKSKTEFFARRYVLKFCLPHLHVARIEKILKSVPTFQVSWHEVGAAASSRGTHSLRSRVNEHAYTFGPRLGHPPLLHWQVLSWGGSKNCIGVIPSASIRRNSISKAMRLSPVS